MRGLVTGVAGFIGSHIAERLLKDGWEVVGIDNLSTGLRENVPEGVEFYEGDICLVDPSIGPYDVIWHCAASYKDRDRWERDSRTNVAGTLRVIRIAQQSSAKIVYCQTSLCYGPNPVSPVVIDAPLNPVGSYAVSKTAGEAYIRDSGVPYVSLRLANIYGPRNLSGPIPAFYKRLSDDKDCTIVDSRRDFVFVDDMVWVAVTAGRQGEGVYHVSSGSDYSIEEVYRGVVNAMGLDLARTWPKFQDRGPDDVARLLLDPSKTADEFGWQARTPLFVGIDKAVEWYRQHGVAETFTHLSMKG